MLSFRQLQMVEALARRGHFARAAKDLRISQPALSQGLRAIENDLGERLFERGKGEFKPTLFGRIVLDHGKAVLRNVEALNREIALAKALDAGTFTVSASLFPTELWAPHALGRLCEDHPKLTCQLLTTIGSRCVQDVAEGLSDVAITDIEDMAEKPDLVAYPLETLQFRCFARAGHALHRRKKPDQTVIMTYPFVGPPLPKSRSMEWWKKQGLEQTARMILRQGPNGSLQPRICVGSFSAIMHAVLKGDAIGWAPEPILKPHLARGSIRVLDVGLPPLYSQFAQIVRRGEQLTPATRRFIKIAQSVEL